MGSENPQIDEHAGDHAECDPNVCFTAKLRYWRSQKHHPTMIPDGWRAKKDD